MSTTYRIEYSDGRTVECETYEEAVEILDAECEVVGHDGDLTEHGDRTLAWLTEEDSDNDAGANAYAEIVEAMESQS